MSSFVLTRFGFKAAQGQVWESLSQRIVLAGPGSIWPMSPVASLEAALRLSVEWAIGPPRVASSHRPQWTEWGLSRWRFPCLCPDKRPHRTSPSGMPGPAIGRPPAFQVCAHWHLQGAIWRTSQWEVTPPTGLSSTCQFAHRWGDNLIGWTGRFTHSTYFHLSRQIWRLLVTSEAHGGRPIKFPRLHFTSKLKT